SQAMISNRSSFARVRWILPALALAVLCASPLPAQEETQSDASGKPVVFLDKNPRIVAYQLGRLSNAQLLMVDRNTSHAKYIPVFEAILARPGLKAEYRKEALEALAVLNKTDVTTEILSALKRITGDKAGPVLVELSRMLAAQKADALQKHQAALEQLAVEGAQPAQREAAFAALAGFASADAVWKLAEEKSAVASLLSGLPLQPDAARRAALFPKVQPLLKAGGDAAVLRGAIAAAASMPGQEATVFATLAKLFADGHERAAVVNAIQIMPKDKWPQDQLKPLADAIVDYAGKVPTPKRTENDYVDATQLGKDLAARLPQAEGSRIRRTLAGLGVNVIRLRTLHEQMFFDKTLMVVEAAKPVRIIFENTDAMQHNVVIVAPGAAEEIGPAAEKLPPTPDAQGRLYVPDSPKVLHATKMLNPGEKTTLDFIAPSNAEKYPYLCTFPGHWQRMRGILLVVDDLEDYFAKNPAEPTTPTITEWTLADLEPALEKLPMANPLKGEELFTRIGCVACHQAGSAGTPYGPNLTGVFAKYKNDPKLVLTEILDPSKNIEPRYRSHNITIGSDDPVLGLIVKEEGDHLLVQIGPGEAMIQKYVKKDIKSREPQPSSLMPAGLLNLLSKDQILDLLAFLKAGGATAHKHKH
ncbi:MAG: c-type cytochrome, partial [Verrucomicrobiota bacterium]